MTDRDFDQLMYSVMGDLRSASMLGVFGRMTAGERAAIVTKVGDLMKTYGLASDWTLSLLEACER